MENKAQNTCVVCRETSEQVALHYTRMLCNGCRAFFKRTVQGKVKISPCKSQGQCVVDPNTRKLCKACRFQACQRAGVDSSKVQQPKDEYQESSEEQQAYHGIHLDSPQLLNPSSSFMSQASLPFYDGSQSMFAMSQATNLNLPSPGVFNQNFGNAQGAYPYTLGDNRLKLHSINRPATANRSMLPTTCTKNENYSRLSYSHNLHSHNAVDFSDATLYMGMARNVSMVGQCYFYNSVQANLDTVRAYQGTCPQSLFHSWSDGRLQNTLPASFNDASPISEPGNNAINHLMTDVSRTETLSSKSSASSEIRDKGHDETLRTLYGRCRSQFSEAGFKHEISNPDHEFPKCKEELTAKDGDSVPFTVGERSQVLNKQEEPATSLDDIRHSSNTGERRLDVQMSEKSNAFMIDMLLSAENRLQPTEDECYPFISKDKQAFNSLSTEKINQHSPTVRLPLELEFNRKYKTNSTNDTSHYLHTDTIPSLSTEVSVCSLHMHQVRHSTPRSDHGELRSDHGELRSDQGEQTFSNELEDVDVYNTDENINELNILSREGHNDQERNERLENRNLKVHSRGQKLLKVNCWNNVTSKSINAQDQLSVSFDKTKSGHGLDSGLGSSVHVSSSGQQKTTKRQSIKRHTETSNNEKNENFVTPPTKRKRRPHADGENKYRGGSSRRRGLSSVFSPTKYAPELCIKKDCLRELSENSQIEETACHKHKSIGLPFHFASGTESSSEDEAATMKVRLYPQLTSTPITRGEDDKIRHFLKLVCAFADYCRRDERNTICSDNTTQQDYESLSPESPGCKWFNKSGCQENHPERLQKIELLQREVMTKVRCLDSYTMSEFKADVCRLSSLVQDFSENAFPLV